jgi:hypothetical protein
MPDNKPGRPGCPSCGWPVDPPGDREHGRPAVPTSTTHGETLSTHHSVEGTVEYRRCVCGHLLVLLAGTVVGGAGPRWGADPSLAPAGGRLSYDRP